MRKIERGDVLDILQYEKVRERSLQRVIEVKRERRLSVGRYLTFVFENRDTVLFQIEEMMRAERIVHEERIADEIDVYNSMIPGDGELSATMLIEITNPKRIKPVLDRFMGIDKGQKVWLEFAENRVYGLFEEGHSSEVKLSAVHFVRFPFSPQHARQFCRGDDQVYLVADHPNYKAKATVPKEVKESLVEDLGG